MIFAAIKTGAIIVINYVAIAFVYGYNSNTMTAYSAELNIAPAGYTLKNSGNLVNTHSERNILWLITRI